jgi:hypothetical protein
MAWSKSFLDLGPLRAPASPSGRGFLLGGANGSLSPAAIHFRSAGGGGRGTERRPAGNTRSFAPRFASCSQIAHRVQPGRGRLRSRCLSSALSTRAREPQKDPATCPVAGFSFTRPVARVFLPAPQSRLRTTYRGATEPRRVPRPAGFPSERVWNQIRKTWPVPLRGFRLPSTVV